MKKFALAIAAITLPILFIVAQEKTAMDKAQAGKMAAAEQIVVPKGKTYVKLDAKGKEMARFKAGQTMARTIDCAQVPCPSTFGKDVVCWKCKERPEGTTTKVQSRN